MTVGLALKEILANGMKDPLKIIDKLTTPRAEINERNAFLIERAGEDAFMKVLTPELKAHKLPNFPYEVGYSVEDIDAGITTLLKSHPSVCVLKAELRFSL